MLGFTCLGSLSLFATSLERGYVFSQRLPRAASIRPQAFTTSRRLLPLSSSWAYSIPQPRPGFLVVQGLLSQRSHPSSSEGAFLLAVASPPLVFASRLSPSRARPRAVPLGFEASIRAGPRSSGPVIHLAQSRSPLRISCSSRVSLSRRRPPLSRWSSAHHVTRSSFLAEMVLRRSRPDALRGVTFHVRPGKHEGDPRAVLQARARFHELRIFGTPVRSAMAMASLTDVRGLDPLLEDRARSRGSSPRGESSSGVTASFVKQRCRGSVQTFECFLIDPQSVAYPGSFRIPEPVVSALASRRTTAGSGSSTSDDRARSVHSRLAAFAIVPVRTPRGWSRSHAVFFASFDV